VALLVVPVGCDGKDSDCENCGGTAGASFGGNAGFSGAEHGGTTSGGRAGAGGEGDKLCKDQEVTRTLPWIFPSPRTEQDLAFGTGGTDAGASGTLVQAGAQAQGGVQEAGGESNGNDGGVLASAGSPAAIQGGAGGVGAGGETSQPSSGCVVLAPDDTSFDDVRCEGLARVQAEAGVTSLIFEDSSKLQYLRALAQTPFVDGERVSVQYAHQTYSVCPFCGILESEHLSVRAELNGELLYYAHAGETKQSAPAEVMAEVFGAELVPALTCGYSFTVDCVDVSRVHEDFVLKTTPEQILRHGVATDITNPEGTRFNVQISESSDVETQRTNCSDGSLPAADSALLISRLR